MNFARVRMAPFRRFIAASFLSFTFAFLLQTALATYDLARAGNVRVVEAEASYMMTDSDTLAAAEEQVLLKAKRKAVEQSGVYIETFSRDIETTTGEKTSHLTSLGVRTLAAAVTETQILDRRRSLENDRPVLHVRIRATVHLDWLEDAIKRLKSNEQLAEHHRQLQREYDQIKTQLDHLRKQLQERGTVQIGPGPALKNHRAAKELVRSAIQTQYLPDKIDRATQAIGMDNSYVDAYIIRGQTYLKVASLASSKKDQQADVKSYIIQAGSDFDRALSINPENPWALLGRGDTFTWQGKSQSAAESYERLLQIDPLFDIARQRLIALQTSVAKKQATAGHWRDSLATLEKLLREETTQSWVAYQKEAYLLRSQAYQKLGEPERAIADLTKVVGVDPTNAQAFWIRARVYRDLNLDKRAKEDSERACELGLAEACSLQP